MPRAPYRHARRRAHCALALRIRFLAHYDTVLGGRLREGTPNSSGLLAQCGANDSGQKEMQPYQWFFLGMMVAWIPALVVLAVMLRRALTKPTETETEGRIGKRHWWNCRSDA